MTLNKFIAMNMTAKPSYLCFALENLKDVLIQP